MLQRLFESEKKSYVMINSTSNNLDRWSSGWQNFNNSVKSLLCFEYMDDNQLYLEHKEIQHLISLIDTSRFVGWNQWCLTDQCRYYPTGKTGHLLEQGHKATALHILKHDPN
jgi:hypothetical protein